MSDDDFDVLRQYLVVQISAQTIFLPSRLGNASLGRRVLDVVGKVPRHAFVRHEVQHLAYADCLCRAAAARRSRSRSSSP